MRRSPNPHDIHVGQRVRDRRKAIRMSQTSLADAIGVTFQQVQKYERGNNRISASTLFNTATVLKVPVDYFFDGLDAFDTIKASASETGARSFVESREGVELAQLFMRLSAEQRKFVATTAKGLAALFEKKKG